jgi:hypothetical protein
VDINLETGNNFYVETNELVTFTFLNPPISGQGFGFTLLVKVGGGFSVTFPNTVKWPSGVVPNVTADGTGVDAFVFYTYDGGNTYYGLTGGLNLS